MFQKLIIISALLSPVLSMADTGETKTFVFRGQQQSEQIDLRGELTHTEYRDEQVAETCYRQVFSHYETRCRSVPDTVCRSPIGYSIEGILGLFVDEAQAQSRGGDRPGRGGGDRPGRGDGDRPGRGGGDRPGRGGGDRPGRGDGDRPGRGGGDRPGRGGGDRPGRGGGDRPGRGDGDRPGRGGGGGWDRPRCHTEYRQVCNQEPVYRSEGYTCYNTRRISYEVKDADVLNHVKVEFDSVPDQIQPNDTFTVTSSGRTITLGAQGSNQLVYFLEKSQREDNKGQFVETEVLYKVRMLSSAVLNAPVSRGLSELSINQGVVSFMIGAVEEPETLVLGLKIKHKKFFGDKTLIERDLNPTEFVLTAMGDRTRVDIQTSALNLGDTLQDKKIEIRAKARLNVPGNIANPQAISTAQPEQVLEVKIK